MDNPGALTLGDFAITTSGTQIGAEIDGLDGLAALSLQARLAYGSGGTSARVYIQTSLDQGQSWFDIACFSFTTASGVFIANVSGLDKLATPAAPTDAALADDTVLDGPLGERLRAKIVSTGTYGGSTLLSVRAVAR